MPALVARRSLIAACLAAALGGCNESDPLTPPVARGPSVPVGGASSYAYDSGINYNDTWVSATQVIADTTTFTTSQPILDPNTGQQTYSVTVGSDPQTVNTVGGYGYDGQLRVTTAYDAGNSVETSSVRQIGDATSDYSQSGEYNYDPLPQEPTAELGSLAYAQLDPSGGGGGGGGGSCSGCPMMMTRLLPNEISAAASSGERIEKRDAEHVRVTRMMPLDLPVRASADAQADKGADKAAKREAKQVRDYEKHGADWVLKHVRQESSIEEDGRSTKHVQHIEFSNLQFFINKEKDKERKDASEKHLVSASATTGGSSGWNSPGELRPLIACDVDCGGGGGGGGGGTTPPPGYAYEPRVDEIAQIPSDEITHCDAGTGNPLLVLQHGFVSSSDTWRPMHHWLCHDLQFGRIARKSLAWRDTYESQAAALETRLNNERSDFYGGAQVILVGHSNGGMVSRYMARNQHSYNIRGVVTVGTPHKGAPAARHLTSLIIVFGWGPYPAAAICPYFGMAGCSRFGELAFQPVSAWWRTLWDHPPVLNEMQPNSPYHASFNAQPESFPRFGIQSYIWQHWQIWKQNGDMKCFPEESCGGYKEVKKTDRIYHHSVSCSIIGFFTVNWAKAFKCGLDAGFMKGIDGVYNKYTRDGDTDGIVPKYSQLYPNVPQTSQYEIYDGPHHIGETKAIVVRDRLETILTQRLGIQRK
jgi:pimeloyl-ACP methyl ester carboxylesterase